MAKTNYQTKLNEQKEKLKLKLNAPTNSNSQNVNPNVAVRATLPIKKLVKSGSEKNIPLTPESQKRSIKAPSLLSKLSSKFGGSKKDLTRPPTGTGAAAAAPSEKSNVSKPIHSALSGSNGLKK